MLDAEGFIGRVIDKTPTGAPGAGRGEEIAAWLAEHAVGGYVIIDDHGDMGELRAQLVLTHPAHGLQPGDAPRAIEILRGPGVLVSLSGTRRGLLGGARVESATTCTPALSPEGEGNECGHLWYVRSP